MILDEATSAVDNQTEAVIQLSLAMITQNRTTIAIAQLTDNNTYHYKLLHVNKVTPMCQWSARQASRLKKPRLALQNAQMVCI